MIRLWSRARDACLQRWWRVAIPAWLRAQGVLTGDGLVAYGWPIVSGVPAARIRLGQGVTLCSLPRFTALGSAGPVILRVLGPGAVIEIGDGSGLSGTVVCAAQSVHIGRDCLIGANVMIFDTDFHPLHPAGRRRSDDLRSSTSAPVHIGDRVFIGAGSMVLKGVRIGDGAVIGAGSVVTGDVPAMHIAAGNPARVIRAIEGVGD